jgi:hypothetical protein
MDFSNPANNHKLEYKELPFKVLLYYILEYVPQQHSNLTYEQALGKKI